MVHKMSHASVCCLELALQIPPRKGIKCVNITTGKPCVKYLNIIAISKHWWQKFRRQQLIPPHKRLFRNQDLRLGSQNVSTVEPPLSGHSWGTSQWPLNGGWPLNRGLSEMSIIFSRNITLIWNKRATRETLLVHNKLSPSISQLSVSSAW